MKPHSMLRLGLAFTVLSSPLFAPLTHAFTFTLEERGGLTGSVVGGGGSVTIASIGPDHWQVTVADLRIGNQVGIPARMAFQEPELVSGLTAYNNVQLLSLTPGQAVFDVLSDEFSPYAVVIPNGASFPAVATDIQGISLRFIDHSDHDLPETGATALLLGAACLVLGQRRRRV